DEISEDEMNVLTQDSRVLVHLSCGQLELIKYFIRHHGVQQRLSKRLSQIHLDNINYPQYHNLQLSFEYCEKLDKKDNEQSFITNQFITITMKQLSTILIHDDNSY